MQDVSPVPPTKRAKSADNHSPSPLDNSTNGSPTPVLGEDMTVRSRKNSCDGSPPSRRSSPHDTSNYDENHNDEDPAQAANREEQNEAPMDPMDFSNKNATKKFECQLLPSQRASPNNPILKSEPLDLVYPHSNSNQNDNDDDDSSHWEDDQSPPPTNLFPPTPIDSEDPYQNSRNFFENKLFDVIAAGQFGKLIIIYFGKGF